MKSKIIILWFLLLLTSCNYKYTDSTVGLIIFVIPIFFLFIFVFNKLLGKFLKNIKIKKKNIYICQVLVFFLSLIILIARLNIDSFIYNNSLEIVNGTEISTQGNTIIIGSNALNERNTSTYISIFEDNNGLILKKIYDLSKLVRNIKKIRHIVSNEKYIAILVSCGYDNVFKYSNIGKIIIFKKNNDEWIFEKTIIPDGQNERNRNLMHVSIFNNYLAIGAPDINKNGCVFIYNLNSSIEKKYTIFPPDYKFENNNINFGINVLLCEQGLFVTEHSCSYFNKDVQNNNFEKRYVDRIIFYSLEKDNFFLSNIIYFPDNTKNCFGTFLKYNNGKLLVGKNFDTQLLYNHNFNEKKFDFIKEFNNNPFTYREYNNLSFNYLYNNNIYMWKDKYFNEIDFNDIFDQKRNIYKYFFSKKYFIFSSYYFKNNFNSNGYVYIFTILPDGNFKLKYVISNKIEEKKIEFYDMLAEGCFNAE